MQSADKDQQVSGAVIAGKLHVRCRCKIRYVWSKFTAASRGSLYDSMAFLFNFGVLPFFTLPYTLRTRLYNFHPARRTPTTQQ